MAFGARALRPGRIGRRRIAVAALAASTTLLASLAAMSLPSTTAMFTASAGVGGNAIVTKHIFPGTRVTSGFDVRDASSGSEVDRSSPFAVAGDGRTITTSAWSATFAAARLLQFDLGSPLPAGLAVTSPVLRLRFASGGAAATACVYAEVRLASSGSLLATYGSAASPLGCVTGTTLLTLTQAIAVVASTDTANDLRIRVFGDDSGSNGMVVDEVRVTGSTPYAGFSLYPVRFTDAADSTPVTTPWDLQGP